MSETVRLLATLLTDLPLDEQRLRGVLLNISHTSLAGSIQQYGLDATHSFGNAAKDFDVRDVTVRCRPANTSHKSALVELRKHGFQPATALEFETAGDSESDLDAWSLVRVYAEELKGWVVTAFLDFEEARSRTGSDEGLLQAPVGGKKRGVLIASNALELLA
ncbi:MAG TPA: hypothetical protein QGG59_03015 [Planctomycetota bacterium]|nr:hypothetical protein [Planctomycetota bacterium]